MLEQVHRGGVYTKENVRVEHGLLIIETVAQNLTIRQGSEDVPFYVSSGAVNTSGLFEQKRGRWEASVKLPMVSRSPGYTLHSSIWLFADYATPGNTGCPHEIDVVEQYTATAGAVSSAVANLHPFNGTRAGSSGCRKADYARAPSTARGDWTSNFTLFTVDWTESWIAMYVDGEVYANFDTQQAAVGLFTDPLFLALTACVMERVPVIGADVLPQRYLVDYVKVYEWIDDERSGGEAARLREGTPSRLKTDEAQYEIYAPTITKSIVVSGRTSALKYNHDCSDVQFDGEWITVWNGNTSPDEAKPGQLNYMSTSFDRMSWSAPVRAFSGPASMNPVSCNSTCMQWQPNLIVLGTKLGCAWSQGHHSTDA